MSESKGRQTKLTNYFRSAQEKKEHQSEPTSPHTDQSSLDDIAETSKDNGPKEKGGSSNMNFKTSDISSEEPTDISLNKDGLPVQPKLKVFPQKMCGEKARSFSSGWYEKYAFLEYSVERDLLFCFICRHFSSDRTNALIVGYSDWSNLGKILKKHFEAPNSSHQFCHTKYLEYKKTKVTGPISTQVSAHHKSNVVRNRNVLSSHIEVVLLCAIKGLPLQGQTNSKNKQPDNQNTGNFLAILELLKRHDPELAKQEQEMPSNSKYTHHSIQNEIINICGDLVRQMIVKEVNDNGGKYSVIADESKDTSGDEQLTVCIRYVCGSKITERFLGFVKLEKFDADYIALSLSSFLKDCGLNLKNCVSQSYDGANVMSGDMGGVRAKVETLVGDFCPYVHCKAHKLNLVLVHACNGICEVRDTLGLVQAIYNFQSNSARRSNFFKEAQETKGYSSILAIPQSCDPRWSSKKKGIEYFKTRLDAVLLAFETLLKKGKPDELPVCTGFKNQLQTFKTVFMLTALDEILSVTNLLSEYLQNVQLVYTRANSLCQATIKTLREMKCSTRFEVVWKNAEKLAENVQVTVPTAFQVPEKRRKTRSTQLKDFLVCSTTGSRSSPQDDENPKQSFEIIWNKVLDKFIEEMKRRFEQNEDIGPGINSADPKSESFLKISDVKKFCGQYKRFFGENSSIQTQIQVAKNLLVAEKLTTISSCQEYLLSMKDSFPELLLYFELVETIPVSSATGERSFSALKRIKNRTRSTMGQERTSNLTLLTVESDLSNILYEKPVLVVDQFARVSTRRLDFII